MRLFIGSIQSILITFNEGRCGAGRAGAIAKACKLAAACNVTVNFCIQSIPTPLYTGTGLYSETFLPHKGSYPLRKITTNRPGTAFIYVYYDEERPSIV